MSARKCAGHARTERPVFRSSLVSGGRAKRLSRIKKICANVVSEKEASNGKNEA